MTYYLAIDIGASSGRHILASVKNNKIQIEEIYRFKNIIVEKNNHFYWDIDYLFEEIKKGIQEAVKIGKKPKTIGIDTWAVDYVLLNNKEQRVKEIHAYRDNRVDRVLNDFNKEDLYIKTGIQYQKFNTLYQLASDDYKIKKQTKSFLMIPDYLHYLLTGKKVNEYTNMTTTQLLNYQTDRLDKELLKQIGVNEDIFNTMVMPGTNIGKLSKQIQEELGVDASVVVPATHDTGSAYMAAIENNSIIISSGTWSLLGIETSIPIVTKQTMQANFTNEGGYNKQYRFLKNIMGLWVIQEVAREFEGQYSFGELVDLARENPFEAVFDVNDSRFLKPENMVDEILFFFKERNMAVPNSIGEIAYCVYYSLAICYREAIDELESITNKNYSTINIIGGGCQNGLLNEMIAKVTHKRVIAGPIEATALGNVLCQLLSDGVIKDLTTGRKMIQNSFSIKEYKEK